MKRIIASTLIGIALGSFTCYANQPAVLRTKADSFSYALGCQYAANFVKVVNDVHMTDNVDYNKDFVIQGFSETIKSNKALKEDSLSNIIVEYLMLKTEKDNYEYLQKTKENRKNWAKKYKKYKDIGPNQDSNIPNVKLKVLKEGTGNLITMENFVVLDYECKLDIDDKVVDSSKERGEDTGISVDMVIPGFSHALCHLKEGASATFLVPYELGYGKRSIASIPPFADLLYNVEVKKVYKNIDEYKIAMGFGSYSIDADAVDENSQQDYNVEDADNSDVDY